MKEILVSLAKLLATDDAFNLAFSSLATDGEKYELAKTKFTDLTREDFSDFLEELHGSEKASLSELSADELAMIAGGAGGLATKLAAAAMLVTTLGAAACAAPVTEAVKIQVTGAARRRSALTVARDDELYAVAVMFKNELAHCPRSGFLGSVRRLSETPADDEPFVRRCCEWVRIQAVNDPPAAGRAVTQEENLQLAVLCALEDVVSSRNGARKLGGPSRDDRARGGTEATGSSSD